MRQLPCPMGPPRVPPALPRQPDLIHDVKPVTSLHHHNKYNHRLQKWRGFLVTYLFSSRWVGFQLQSGPSYECLCISLTYCRTDNSLKAAVISLNHSVNQPINQPTNKSINQSVSQNRFVQHHELQVNCIHVLALIIKPNISIFQ